jgi:hypothetical protein
MKLMLSNKFAVTLRDLSKRFGNFIAVNRVSLDVRRGESFGFLRSGEKDIDVFAASQRRRRH